MLKTDNTFKAAAFPEATGTLLGRALTASEGEYSEQSDVNDLPIFRNEDVIISCWKLKDWRARLRVLITGKVYVTVLGFSQPPLALRADSPFDNEESSQP